MFNNWASDLLVKKPVSISTFGIAAPTSTWNPACLIPRFLVLGNSFFIAVWINTANPTYDLEITGTGDNQFFVGNTASKYFAIRDDVIRYYGMQGKGMRIITNNDASIKHGIGKGDFKVDD